MKNRLSDVNPYLRDPVKRKRALLKSAISSSAIEGIRVTSKDLRTSPGKPAAPKIRSKS
jgi:Fic family protein